MAGRPPTARKPRSLLPREHGVYAEVAFPLVTALLLGGLSIGAGLLSTLVVAAFLAHEPILVLLGRRGKNLRERLRDRAQRRLKLLGVIGGVAGLGVLGFAAIPALVVLVALTPWVAAILWLVGRKREKTWLGESLVAVLFSMLGTAVSLTAGVPTVASLAVGLVWSVVFLLGTASVHAIFARKMAKTEAPQRLTSTIAWLTIALVGGWAAVQGPMWPLAVVPAALLTIGVGVAKLQPKKLRAVGFMLVAVDLVVLTWLLLFLDA